ncbi:MAG TPA: VOC family protein [Polyangiaceae bacterium]|jgi:predicted enzyme related to lactoylglutathione lyase|nr:VOC family protein [Polyangiaceae bacterium]
MSVKIFSIVIPVSDINAAKAVYTALYGAPHMDSAYYVGYKADGLEVGLTPQADRDLGPVAYMAVEHLDAAKDELVAAGAKERVAPRQVAPGMRVCVLEDKDGNPIGLSGK